MPTKTGKSSTGSRRTWAFAPLCPRVCRSGGNFGVVVERLILLNPLALCLAVDGSLTRRADVGIRPYRGDGNSVTGRTHRPSLIPPCRGRRPRRPASTARPAPAERGGQGIRSLPGPKVSPRASRLMKPKRGTANHLPPAAGGTRLRGPTRRGDFFSWTVHGPFSFCQEQKENGGWIPAVITAFPAPQSGASPSQNSGSLPSPSCFFSPVVVSWYPWKPMN